MFSISSSFRPFYHNLFPKATEDSRRLPKSNEKVRPLPKISEEPSKHSTVLSSETANTKNCGKILSTPDNSNLDFKGNREKFELPGVLVIRSTKQLTGKEKMAWEIMQATSTLQSLKNTHCWALYLNWTNKKVKTKNTWLLKYFNVLDCSTLFVLVRRLKHGSSYRG